MFEHTPLEIIRDDEGVKRLADRLAEATVLAVDTESDSMYAYQEKVCLLQFTDSHGDAIVDPLKVKDMSPLKPIFDDPGIIKLFHGADYDVVCLKRDFDYQTSKLFDTLIAAQFLGLDRLGLADLIDRFFGIPIDKQYQRHDWSRRPLLPEHLDYARGDTHFLLALHTILSRRLERVGRTEHVAEECALVAQKEWTPRPFDEDGYLRIKGSKGLDDEAMRVLRRLYLYRDDQARELDRPAYKVLGDSILVSVARKQPTSRDELEKLFPRKRAMKRRHAEGLVEAVLEGLEDDFDVPASAPRKRKKKDDGPSVPSRLRGRLADKAQEALKNWRNRLCDESHLYNPVSVASNSDLGLIARARPHDLEEFAAIPGIRAWQVRDHGEAILAVLDDVVPVGVEDDDDDDNGNGGKRRRRRRR